MNLTVVRKESTTKSKPLTYLNRFFIFCQLFVLGGLATIVTSRLRFEEISNRRFENSDYLMNSLFIDLFVRIEMLIPLVFLFISILYKERRFTLIKNKIMVNLVSLILITCFTSILISKLYAV